jgi:hypothetical protein
MPQLRLIWLVWVQTDERYCKQMLNH